jgi:hypothetical protein
VKAKVKLAPVRRAIVRLEGLNSIIAVTYPRRFGGKSERNSGHIGGGSAAALAKKAGERKARLRLTFSSPHQQVFPHPHQTQPQHHTRYTEPSRSNTPRHTHRTHEALHITHTRALRVHTSSTWPKPLPSSSSSSVTVALAR